MKVNEFNEPGERERVCEKIIIIGEGKQLKPHVDLNLVPTFKFVVEFSFSIARRIECLQRGQSKVVQKVFYSIYENKRVLGQHRKIHKTTFFFVYKKSRKQMFLHAFFISTIVVCACPACTNF
jgi:hypothetical protein